LTIVDLTSFMKSLPQRTAASVTVMLALCVHGAQANPFFAMDTGIRDAAHTTRESQVEMVSELGYDGISLGLGSVADLSETVRLLDGQGLKLHAVYVTASIDDELPRRLAGAMPVLKGRGVCIWLAMQSSSCGPSSPAGDVLAVPLLRELAGVAATNGASVSLYPHANMWLERVEDAVRVAEKVDRPNVGVTFNLCHWLKVSPDQDLVSLIRKAAPRLTMVTINGADRGKDWRRLILPLDRGTYDVGRVLEALRDVVYTGPIGFQGYGIGGDAHGNLSRTMDAWQRMRRTESVRQRELIGRTLASEIATYRAGDSRRAFTIVETRLRDAPPEGREIVEDRLLDILAARYTTTDAKRAVIRILGRWGGPHLAPRGRGRSRGAGAGEGRGRRARLVSALVPLLDDPGTCHAALEALRGLSCPESAEALRQALERLQGNALIGAINVVGEQRDTFAADVLAKLARNSESAVARAAIGALGAVGSVETAAILSVLNTPESLARTRALLKCANCLAMDGAGTDARELFADVFANGRTTAVRVAALSGLARTGDAKAAETVIGALASDNREICRAAAGLLADLRGADVGRLAAERLPSLPEDAQIVLIAGLAQRRDRSVAKVVATAAASDSGVIRLAAVRALGSVGGVAQIPLLLRMALQEGELGEAARDSLCRLDAPGVGTVLLKELADRSAEGRSVLIGIVADRHMDAAVPVLVRLVREGRADERLAALGAIRSLSTSADFLELAGLFRVAMTEAEWSRLAGILKRIVSRRGVRSAETEALIQVLNDADPGAKPAVLEVIGRVGADSALDGVEKCLASEDAEVGKAAVRVLADWPNAKPLSLLREVARNETDESTAVLALRGYVGMLVRQFRSGDKDVVSALMEAADVARRPEDKRFVVEELESLRDMVAEIDGCIGAWDLAGPYMGVGRSLHDTAFPPERNGGAELTQWQPVDALAGPFTKFLRPGDVNLGAIVGGDNRVAYVRTHVFSPVDREAVLELGADDGVKVWLNGEQVFTRMFSSAHRRAAASVPVRLKQGDNVLMLKVTQLTGEWGASARIRE